MCPRAILDSAPGWDPALRIVCRDGGKCAVGSIPRQYLLLVSGAHSTDLERSGLLLVHDLCGDLPIDRSLGV